MPDILPFSVLSSGAEIGDLASKVEVSVRPLFDGTHVLIRFPNNFGASIIRHSESYGGNAGLWEMAVIKWSGRSGTDEF